MTGPCNTLVDYDSLALKKTTLPFISLNKHLEETFMVNKKLINIFIIFTWFRVALESHHLLYNAIHLEYCTIWCCKRNLLMYNTTWDH